MDRLSDLLEAVGEDQHDLIIKNEAETILAEERCGYDDARFLVQAGQMDAASDYLLKRIDQVNGDLYGSVLPLAEAMEAHGIDLTASMLYRALLDSILQRAVSKYYHHGVRYLKKLDDLAPKIDDWLQFVPHQTYLAHLRDQHGRKKSFWSRYGED